MKHAVSLFIGIALLARVRLVRSMPQIKYANLDTIDVISADNRNYSIAELDDVPAGDDQQSKSNDSQKRGSLRTFGYPVKQANETQSLSYQEASANADPNGEYAGNFTKNKIKNTNSRTMRALMPPTESSFVVENIRKSSVQSESSFSTNTTSYLPLLRYERSHINAVAYNFTNATSERPTVENPLKPSNMSPSFTVPSVKSKLLNNLVFPTWTANFPSSPARDINPSPATSETLGIEYGSSPLELYNSQNEAKNGAKLDSMTYQDSFEVVGA